MSVALYDSLDSLAQGIEERGGLSPEYWAKQIHKIPDAKSVDRVPWLLARLTGKVILSIGCNGPLHEQLLKVCTRAYGIDEQEARYPHFRQMDIEAEELPTYEDVEVVLLGEVIEHVVSAGVLLWQVRTHYPGREIVVSVPNAQSESGRQWLSKGYENVNRDHVAYYSYWTLRTLLEKSSYTPKEFYWYGGRPYFAEGLIMTAH
jgi:2-polyprenyl-3-methyl-5-hydroxy-6-metoxy-1,4-benzoquinol methylase